MLRSEALWNQQLERLADQLLARVAKQPLRLPVDQKDPPITVYDDQPAGGCLAAKASTSPLGGVVYGQPASRQHGVAGWLTPTLTNMPLAAEQSQRAGFRLSVPAGTPPGDYVAALVAGSPAKATSTATTSGGRKVRFLVSTRTIVAVVVHIPGPSNLSAHFGAPQVRLLQQRQLIGVLIHDTSNRLIKPYLTARLRRCSSRAPLLRLSRQLDTFVPHTSIEYPWYLTGGQSLEAGCYQIRLALYRSRAGALLATYSGRLQVGRKAVPIRKATRNAPHAGTPWWIVALAGALALLLIAALLLLRARRERRRLLQQLAERER